MVLTNINIMKKSTLLQLGFPCCDSYVANVGQDGLKLDLSKSTTTNCCCPKGNVRSKSMISVIMLFVLFLFSNLSFAQQPACNLSGPLKAKYDLRGGDKITITAETINTAPGAIYLWSFKTNTSNATFASENGRNFIEVNSGVNGGGYTVDLKIVNPSTSEHGNSNPCHCSQSISVTK